MKYEIVIIGIGTPNVFDAARCKECGEETPALDDGYDAHRMGVRHQREAHASS